MSELARHGRRRGCARAGSSAAAMRPWTLCALWSLAVAAAVTGQELPIGGQVESAAREPLVGATVELHRALSRPDFASAALDAREPEPLRTARTDANGRFELAAPAPGMWTLILRAPGRQPRSIALEPLFEPVELRRVVLPPSRPVSIAVRDPAGAPVAGALVVLSGRDAPQAFDPSRELTEPLVRFGRTDETGVARVDVAAGEEWSVGVAAAGFAPASLDERDERDGGSLTVRLAAGQPRELRVRRGDAVVPGALVTVGPRDLPWGRTGEDGMIVVAAPQDAPLVVRASAGGPALALVRLEPLPAGSSPAPTELELATSFLSGSVLARARGAADRTPLAGAWVWDVASPRDFVETDREGRYRLETTPANAAPARIVADAPGALQETTVADPALAAQSQGPDFALRLGGRLVGLVVDAEGRPVPEAEIRREVTMRGMAFGAQQRPVRTGADGRFTITPVAPGEPSSLRVRAEGFAPERVEVAGVEAGGERRVRIELDAGRRALGTVVDLSDRAIAGAEVTLTESLGGSELAAILQRRFSGDDDTLRASTDADGRFELVDLAPGRYDLGVRAPGFAPARVPAIEVPDQASMTEIGTVALSPGVAIEGVVRDADGAPLEGVEIRKQEEGGVLGVARFVMPTEQPADGLTDAEGRFRLEDLAEDARVSVSAQLAGYGTTTVQGVRAPSEEPLELVLEPAATLRGVVVDRAGKGVPGAFLRLTAEMGSGTVDLASLGSRMRNESADEEGRFEIEDVVSGRYELRASGHGFQESSPTPIEVAAGRDPAEVRLVLERGAMLRGQVLGDDGEPVGGATVRRVEQRRSPFEIGGVPNVARTDAEGRYRLEGLPPGPSSFSVEHGRHPKQVRDFVVQPGENLLDFRLEPGRAIEGRVIDETGLPVAGATVSARAPSDGFVITFGDGGDPVTDERGEFTVEGLGDGSYRVTARKSGYAEASTADPVRIDGGSVYGIELRLSVGAAITGQVLGLEFDELANVQVLALQPGSVGAPSVGQVDYEGHYRLDNVASGDWMVIANVGQGGKTVRKTVTVEPGAAEVILDLDFGGGLAIRGQVLRDGEPVRGATVFALGRSTTGSSQGTTDQDGRFVLLNLESDTYRVVVASLGSGSSQEQEVELAGADAEVLIELRESAIAGRVIDAADGAPVAGAAITVVAVDEDSLLRSFGGFGTPPRTAADGSFRIGGVSPGTWMVRAEKEGYAAGAVQVELADGADVDGLEIELDPARGLNLVVLTAYGRPVDQATVIALDTNERPVLQGSYSAGEGGVVRLDELPAGRWTLLVASGGSATASVSVEAPGEDVPVRLPEAGGLRVRVPELEGTGLQASARLHDEAGRPYRSAAFFSATTKWAVSDGLGTIALVPTGTWTLEVSTPDGTRSWSQVVRVIAGTTLEVVVE